MRKTFITLNSLYELEVAAAGEIVRTIGEAVAARGVCHCAFSGGHSPQGLHRMLGSEPYKQQIDWNALHVYFGDERMVPPTDPESNFGMAHSSLLSHVPLAADHIHRIHGEMPPEDAAVLYERELAAYMPDRTFDLMMLGIGEDGHTASLFPGTDILDEKEKTAAAVFVPKLNVWRVSLTLPVINRSRHILFFVSGRSKAPVIRRLRSSEPPTKEMPSTLVRAESGSLVFMCDADAVSDE
ncbi:MAG: 6-phosphogluconolactonase [Acidobacteriota bacterium]